MVRASALMRCGLWLGKKRGKTSAWWCVGSVWCGGSTGGGRGLRLARSLGDKVGVGKVRQGKKARQLKLVGRIKDSGRKCPGRGKDWGG